MSAVLHPQRIHSVHVESLDGELCVYDTARQRVHSLNHTAALVWQRCDGHTAPAELASALAAEVSIDDAEAVVQLTLQELAAAQLLAAPIDEVAPVSRRDLLRRGVAAAAIPAIYSIVAPIPAAAQSVPTGTASFAFTGAPETFVVPGGVAAITIVATGAAGGRGSPSSSAGGLGGRTTATVSVTPGTSLTVRVGGSGSIGVADTVTPVAFNGGGGSAGDGGAGGGASSVHDDATPLAIAGGGGGGGGGITFGGVGGNGGDPTAAPGTAILTGGTGGGGGTQISGGAAGIPAGFGGSTPAAAGMPGTGGTGGSWQPGVFGGGGGGGGYFGGGGGGGGTGGTPIAGGGGGGSSFTAPGVVHEPGVNSGDGSVTISW